MTSEGGRAGGRRTRADETTRRYSLSHTYESAVKFVWDTGHTGWSPRVHVRGYICASVFPGWLEMLFLSIVTQG